MPNYSSRRRTAPIDWSSRRNRQQPFPDLKRMIMKTAGWGLLLVVLIGATVFLATRRNDSDKDAIVAWARHNNYTVERLDRCYIERGPFWMCGKSQRIYKVELGDEKGDSCISWFRTNGWLGLEQAWPNE